MVARTLLAALAAVALLAGCGGHDRRDGAIVFRLGERDAAVDADGAHLRWIPRAGLVSPDGGTRLLFERGGDVWVVQRDGTDAHVLLRDARDAQWSPDGKRIAFVKDAFYLVYDRLVVADADGHDLRAVSEPGSFTQFAWRP